MNRIGTRWRAIAAISMVVLALVTPATPIAHADTSAVFPPNAVVFGKTYNEWSAEWWKWAISIPVPANPTTDMTGQHCRVQQTPPVFFLGSTVFQVPVTLECTVPSGTPLFVTVLAAGCGNVFPPPYFGSTDAERLACAQAITDFVDLGTLKATIDGMSVDGLQNFRFASPPFNFRAPAQNNLFGLPGVTSGRMTSDGYWLMLKPLSPGRHVYHHEGVFTDVPLFQDLTVILNVMR